MSSHDFEVDGVKDEEVSPFFLPTINTVKREVLTDLEPKILFQTINDLEQREREAERENRRKRRSTTRSKRMLGFFGNERLKTFRSPIPKSGEDLKVFVGEELEPRRNTRNRDYSGMDI
jgi:hypothetical protein